MVTSVCIARVDATGTVQEDAALEPSLWTKADFESKNEAYHSLQQHINQVLDQDVLSAEGQIPDPKDELNEKVCETCEFNNPNAKQICDACRGEGRPKPAATYARGEIH